MLKISNKVLIPENEIEWQFIRASGPGGQHVNKTSTAAQLIFDIKASSLPDFYKSRLLNLADHRITKSGKIIIKSQSTRSQEDNRLQAQQQFVELIQKATAVQKKRIATKPTRASQKRRVEHKKQRGAVKAMRRSKTDY
ncbi:alternative ribosome rescue aminoacyl-tRNA hydrolase ArfB [Catenovulum sediminis]|uniref:Alternative ribosome rescue aminoacyl-tRNA hydrolase ArfB n=1 Tax=Catenovulum sediminis TaxID=1740262 RepID=A0ABV1RKB5_9ALTE|nr:alternative ribosome rescue aminoacyl-tRNA hydrolase ArfB [Catenovulum sediminis]